MLVLSRKTLQQIIVGDSIVITVVRIDGDRVKIGIEAPADVRVDRREVRLKIDAEISRNRIEAPLPDAPEFKPMRGT